MKTIKEIKEYAIKCHEETNHTYAGLPYEIHLTMVYGIAQIFANLIPNGKEDAVLASCWTHDLIEDCRQTYNDVLSVCGKDVAEITYALTNEKGKNRIERANSKYYKGIRSVPGADFVKVCDRIANAQFSKTNKSPMLGAYRKENEEFETELYTDELCPMFKYLNDILKY